MARYLVLGQGCLMGRCYSECQTVGCREASEPASSWRSTRFARRRLGAGLALLMIVAYYASPLLSEIALDNFLNPVTFAVLPLAWATALAISGRSRSAALLALGSMLWEEEVGLLTIGIGLYLLLRMRRTRWLGVAVLFAGGTWLGVVERRGFPPPSARHQPSTT